MFSIKVSLHPGEIEVISLAKEKGIKTVLMDDAKGRSVAELAGLKPVGTLWIIMQAVKNRIIDFDEFLSTLEDIIHAGFYFKNENYWEGNIYDSRCIFEIQCLSRLTFIG